MVAGLNDACVVSINEGRLSSKSSDHEEDICWICHESAKLASNSNQSGLEPLIKPCSCNLLAHKACLARWQLQSAGKSEEHNCRFCAATLPDWKEAHQYLPKAVPVMTVVHNGKSHQVAVNPGPEGQKLFQATIRRIFDLGADDSVSLTFGCKVPGSGDELMLEGWDSFDAAVHCASISAGMREEEKKKKKLAESVAPPVNSSDGEAIGSKIRRLFSRQSSG